MTFTDQKGTLHFNPWTELRTVHLKNLFEDIWTQVKQETAFQNES